MVSHLSAAASDLVAHELRHFAVRAAKNRQACRILCRLMERRPVFFLGGKFGENGDFSFLGGIFFRVNICGWGEKAPGPKSEAVRVRGFLSGAHGPQFCASLFAKRKWQEFRGAGGPTWYLIEELLGEVWCSVLSQLCAPCDPVRPRAWGGRLVGTHTNVAQLEG